MGCNAWNHPPGCNCGWGGENYGNYPTTPLPTADDWKRENARSSLDRLNVRSYSTCYVVPNAKCPVCGQSVYFYANDHGSRVYFNELVPPWQKHECTDRRKLVHKAPNTTGAPVRRSQTDLNEIMEAARVANVSFLGSRKSKRKKSRWILYLVVDVKRSGARTTVFAESISDGQNKKVEFAIFAKSAVIETGDFVGKKGEAYSFLRRDTLESIEVFDGHSLDVDEDVPDITIDDSVIPNSPDEMTKREFKHFHAPQMHVKAMTERYAEILRSFAKRNIIGPKLVTHYLNTAGHTTAIGSHWTPRLTYFLICLVDAPMERVQSTMGRKSAGNGHSQKRDGRNRLPQETPQQADEEPMGIDDLIRKLSRLGRITRQGD